MQMKHFVVTVGCEYASGGIEIGKMIAKSLGVEYYDRDLIDKVVEQIGVDRELVEKADSGENVKYEFDTNFGPRYANLTNRVIYEQFEVINKFAEKSSCVIIGRCSNYILKDRKDCLNVFIYAPFEKRVEYVMEKKGVSYDEAAELVKYNDRMLSSRYNYMTNGDMRDCSMRDMMIDSSVLGLEKTAKYILQMIDLRFEN
jgi:cytidylate kinase